MSTLHIHCADKFIFVSTKKGEKAHMSTLHIHCADKFIFVSQI